MDKSINSSGAVLKGLLWEFQGRSFPCLSPLASPAEVDAYFQPNNAPASGINPQDSTEKGI